MKSFTRIISCAAVVVVVVGAVGLTSCADKKQKPWDANSKISLRAEGAKAVGVEAAVGVASNAGDNAVGVADSKAAGRWTAKQIVEKTTDLNFYHPIYKDHGGRAFSENQRDIAGERLMMNSTDIIRLDGTFDDTFIGAEDMLFNVRKADLSGVADTVAYIPNKTLRDAQKIIKAAYDAGDYETVYAAFDKAFRFVPITGAEWAELKRQGKN